MKAFIENSNIEYSSPELRALEKIKTELTKKGQFDPVSMEFNSLTEKLKNKGELGLVNHQSEIKQVLEREIIGRYFYQKGQSLYSLKTDEAIKKATEVLNNISTYKSVLKITRE